MLHLFSIVGVLGLSFFLTACEPITSHKSSKAPFVLHKNTNSTPQPPSQEESECETKCKQNATNPLEMKTCISRCKPSPVKSSIELIPGLKDDHNGSGAKNVQNQRNDTAPA